MWPDRSVRDGVITRINPDRDHPVSRGHLCVKAPGMVFDRGGAAGTVSWTDPENELVGVLMLQQPRGGGNFGKIAREAIID